MPEAVGNFAPIQDPLAMTLKNCSGLKGKRQLLQVCAGAAGLCYPQVDVSPVDDFENISMRFLLVHEQKTLSQRFDRCPVKELAPLLRTPKGVIPGPRTRGRWSTASCTCCGAA